METSDSAIAVTVIGGYLGAGKTTLVNHILRTADEPIAVLVNDFGEINIDADLIQATDGETLTLANGCICCSLVDGFAKALDTVTASPTRPTRLLIEASGVADPATVAAWAHRPGLRLDATVVLVDLERIERQLTDEYIADTVAQQIGGADLLLGNKLDLVDGDVAARVRIRLRELSSAPLLDLTRGQVDTAVVFDQRTDDEAIATDRPVLATPYRTWQRTWPVPVTRDEIDQLLAALDPATSVRVKGVLCFADDPSTRWVLQRVGPRLELSEDGPWRGGPSAVVGIDLDRSVD